MSERRRKFSPRKRQPSLEQQVKEGFKRHLEKRDAREAKPISHTGENAGSTTHK